MRAGDGRPGATDGRCGGVAVRSRAHPAGRIHRLRPPPVRRSSVYPVSPDALPPDPFAGDPQDPARSLDAAVVDEPEQLSDRERDEVTADLADLAVYQSLLEHRGVRGIVVDCGDCAEQHYHDWSLLRASLRQLLDEGRMRPHEPAYDPAPTHYVTWEYCRGFADALLSEG